MDRGVLDLSRLTEFVFNMLKSTEEVKSLLQTQCEEAKFALAPWPIETIRRRELEENSCTCVRIVSSEDHVKEIASGIDRAVAQARKLREKLAINVSEEKKLARRPSLQQIYAPGLKEVGSKQKLSKSKGESNGEPSISGDSCSLKSKSKIMNTKGKSERRKTLIPGTHQPSSNAKKTIVSKRITDQKLIGTSPLNSLATASKADRKVKGKKNFIAANKSNLKHVKTAKSLATTSSRIESSKNLIRVTESSSTMKSLDSSFTGAESAAEIGNLISKISLESEKGCVKPEGDSIEGNRCPIHDKNAPKFIEEKIYTSVDVAEGLDRFGVPQELVKVLKIYHNYLNSRLLCKPSNKRNEKAECSFLKEFESMNKARCIVPTKQKLANLSKDFLPIFKESFNKKLDFIELSRLKIHYTDLDTTCKSLQIRSLIPTKRKMSSVIDNQCGKSSTEQHRCRRLKSVWNKDCFRSLEETSHTGCIRYSNRNQLLELFDFMQRIQQIKYQARLVDLLINEVVPSVRNSVEPTSQEYANAYKMISTISNLLNLRVPVLVRTDI